MTQISSSLNVHIADGRLKTKTRVLDDRGDIVTADIQIYPPGRHYPVQDITLFIEADDVYAVGLAFRHLADEVLTRAGDRLCDEYSLFARPDPDAREMALAASIAGEDGD